MTALALIIGARILHIVSSVVWAGFVIIAGLVLVNSPPNMAAADVRRIRQNAVGRAARIVAPAAVVSLASGLYLFSVLHAGVHTRTEVVLEIGALSAVLSFFVGAIGSRGPEQQLAKLDALSVLSPSETRQVEALNRRVVLSARMTAGLLLLSGTAMAAARFV